MNDTPNATTPEKSGFIELLFKPTDIASLVAFRVIFGGCMLFENVRYALKGEIQKTFIAPEFHFSFPGFGWVTEMSEPMIWIFAVLMCISSLTVMIGAFYRISATILFITFTYFFLLEATAYRNHFYLLSILSLVMIFLPAHRAWSVDAKRRPECAATHVPLWIVWFLRAQLGFVYFFAGVAKMNPDWINGSSMLAIFHNSGRPANEIEFLSQGWVTALFSYSGLLFDLGITFLLLWPRTRLIAFFSAAGFHVTNGIYLVAVGIFPWFMLMASTIYFDPNWPRKLWNRYDKSEPAVLPERLHKNSSGIETKPRPVVLTVLAVYFAIQIFLPIRQYFLPVNTSWTHEGHRWAWRMKLVSKRVTDVKIWTFDPDSGNRIDLSLNFTGNLPENLARLGPGNSIIHAWQALRAAGQPDLFIQFIEDLDATLLEKTGIDYPIYADVRVEMNGRPAQPLIDPTVDLSEVEWTFGPAPWILPLQKTQY